ESFRDEILTGSVLAFEQYRSGFTGGDATREVHQLTHAFRFGDDLALLGRDLISDVFDRGDHAIDLAVVVVELRCADDGQPLAAVVRVDLHRRAIDGRHFADTDEDAATGLAAGTALEYLAANATDH